MLELDGGVGVALPEGSDDPRDPLGGNAGEDAHPEQTLLTGVDDLPQVVLHLLDLPHDVDDAGAHLREPDAPLVPVKDLHPQLRLQVADDVAQAGLGVAQDLSCPGQGPALGGNDDRTILTHDAFSSLKRWSASSFSAGLAIILLCYVLLYFIFPAVERSFGHNIF